ncbi:hypothetical protein FACS1894164_16280 [Spirochaetia bacterium]|nr:hypothetical protein FACS1894164_16280 [Spirochaetia bacterium]
MKKISMIVMLSIVAVVCYAQTNLPRLAVVQFSVNNNADKTQQDSILVRNLVQSQMIASGSYQVITRDAIDALLENQQIAVSSISSAENVKKLQLQNINYIVTGSVDVMGSNYVITINILDVSTGRFSHSDNDFISDEPGAMYTGIRTLVTKFIAGMSPSGDRVVQNGTLTASTVTAGTLRVSGADVNQSANMAAGGRFSETFATGTYSVSMTYSDGYVETRSVTITGNAPSTENFSYRPTPVTGSLTASAITAGTLRVTGAGVNLSGYVSAGGTFSETLAAGTYSVSMTYSDGYVETRSVTITGNTPSSASFSYRPTIVNGTLTVSAVTAGTWRVTGTGVNQSGYVSAGGTFTGTFAAGTYSVSMTYSDGKTETQSLTITGNQTSRLSFTYKATPAARAGFVLVESGTFQMGSTTGDNDEKPVHTVTISKSFYMSKYEVTQKEYVDVMGTNPSNWKGDNLPVEQVTWYEAIEYCNRRSVKEGLTPAYRGSGTSITCNFQANGYRLPTEAEWEYAAKGGNKDFLVYEYAGSNNVDSVGWYDGNSGRRMHPVGTKQANSLGLYDMSGNVWEWCWDWYGNYSSASQTDPTGAASGTGRVGRGGSWSSNGQNLRSAYRSNYTPTLRYGDNGFRVVLP